MTNTKAKDQFGSKYKNSFTETGPESIVARISRSLEWREAEKMVAKKAGSFDENPYHGISKTDTDITQRVSRATEQPENDTSVRTMQRVAEHLEQVNQNLKEDKKRNVKYAKELKNYLK